MIGIGLRAREPYLPSPGGCAFVRMRRAHRQTAKILEITGRCYARADDTATIQ